MTYLEAAGLWSGIVQATVAVLFWFGLDFKQVRRMTCAASLVQHKNKIVLLLVLGSFVWSSFALYFAADYRKTDWMGHDPRWALYKKTDVWARTFTQEVVTVDGNRYINCTFENVTFLINGTAPWEFSGKTVISGHVNIKTDNHRLGAFIALLQRLDSFKPDTKIDLH